MKAMTHGWMLLVTSLAIACSQSSLPTGPPSPAAAGDTQQPRGSPGERDGAGDDDALMVEVRIKGENPGNFGAVLLQVRDVQARTDGQALQVTPGKTVVDLANDQQAWKIGTLFVPNGVSAVEISVRLDDFGGYERGAGADWFDSRQPPIRVTAPVALLAMHGHLVLHVDLQQSVLEPPGRSTLFVPSIAFHY